MADSTNNDDQVLRGLVKSRAWLLKAEPNWPELASNSDFVKNHLSNLDEFRDCLVLYAHEWEDIISCFALNGLLKINDTNYPEFVIGQRMMPTFVGDVDGLVCMHFENQCVVFNPILQTWKTPSVNLPISVPIELANLCYGFGKTDEGDYRILRLCERNVTLRKEREICVYSFSSKSWTTKNIWSSNTLCVSEAACINGWVNFRCDGNLDGTARTIIYAVNLFNLTERELQVPQPCSGRQSYHMYLCCLHDRLGLVETVKTGRRIWRMQEYGDSTSWMIMFTIPVEIFGHPRGYLPKTNELIMAENMIEDDILVYLLDVHNIRRLDRRINSNGDTLESIHTSMASLVSLP